jgi:SAM-dependent methyltransferase
MDKRNAPPLIFDPGRKRANRQRIAAHEERAEAPRYLIEDIAEDVADRLAFTRFEGTRALIVGDRQGIVEGAIAPFVSETVLRDPVLGADPLDEEKPISGGPFDLIVSVGTLGTVNDLPGALVHIRAALSQGGMAILQLPGAGSVPLLRDAMMAADGDRPAARIHPMVDVRSGAALLQRIGFTRQVADQRTVRVRFGGRGDALLSIAADLRAQGQGNAMADRPPPLSRAALQRARTELARHADADGRVTESFEILTLTGWR